MRSHRLTALACILAASALAPVQAQEAGAVAQPARAGNGHIEGTQLAGGSDRTTVSADARRGLGLSVYSNGHALVRDQRELPVLSGGNELNIIDVATRLRPDSVRLETPEGVSVRSQHFSAGAPGYQRLLQAHLGQTVRLVRENPATGEQIETRGRLLAVSEGRPVLRIEDRVEVAGGDFPWRLAFEGLPAGMAWRPGIRASVSAEASGSVNVGASYITAGLGWQADYDLLVPADWTGAELSGWARLSNDSGADFDDARVDLIAGDVAVSQEQPAPMAAAETMRASTPDAERSPVGGAYHRYALPRRVSLADGESRQVPLLSLADVPVQRLYRVSHRAEPRRRSEPRPQPVSVALTVGGDDARQAPLPAGLVRVYQRDADGALQWLGEDRIGHTPVDAPLTLTLGRAFDVQARRRQTVYERLSERSFETAWDITLTNASEQAVNVAVEEQLRGDWEVLEASPSPGERDAQRLAWRVNVDAGDSTTVRYRVRVEY